MNKTVDIPVFIGDDGKQYVLYEDVLKLLKKIKEAKK